MALSAGGVTVDFTLEEIANRGLSIARLRSAAERGIEYVMDTRDLTRYLLDFLSARREEENAILGDILSNPRPAAIDAVAKPSSLRDLNSSQRDAIEKALTQRLTFIWGPPGTGKTKTMAALAACLVRAKRRVLLSALSNMALDQLLLATVSRLGDGARDIPIARVGAQMNPACGGFGRASFDRRSFAAKKAGRSWHEHVERSLLVAANFTVLTLPRSPHPGEFDYVLADEVSMASLPGLAAASFYATKGMALGGDPFQLPPIYPEDADTPNDFFRRNVFDMAGIESRYDPRVAFLDTQYRMQKEIGDLVSDLFYDNELETGTTPLPLLPDFGSRVVFVQSAGRVQIADDSAPEVEEQRRFNEAHAEAVADAVVSLMKAGVPAGEIGVITPYNAQLVMVMEKLRAVTGGHGGGSVVPQEYGDDEERSRSSRCTRRAGRPGAGGTIKASTIHSFQGQERRAMVVDFTDDNVRPSPLTARRELVNVALSRAKEQLVIVGNRYYLTSEQFFRPAEVEMFGKMLGHALIMG
jgi:superfamily I DNA and/or RNA helicase